MKIIDRSGDLVSELIQEEGRRGGRRNFNIN